MSNTESYAEVKSRLDQIVEAVQDENISLDEALSLYEEAIKIGSRVSDLIEQDISLDIEAAEQVDGDVPAEIAQSTDNGEQTAAVQDIETQEPFAQDTAKQGLSSQDVEVNAASDSAPSEQSIQ